jgi:hypothetical protein
VWVAAAADINAGSSAAVGSKQASILRAIRRKRQRPAAGEIEATHERLHKMIEDLEKLDSVILQFNPSYQVEAIKPKAFRPPPDWAHRGEMTKTVLSILRQAMEPMTTRDIALKMLVTRALDKDDQKLLALMTKRVGVALRLQRLNGIARSNNGPGLHALGDRALIAGSWLVPNNPCYLTSPLNNVARGPF